ncbi:MAG: aldo/keto reductase [Phycisphaerae bacterium]|nr:aldo/keto reductase [Phycisphaerae bacterium]
MKSISLGKSSLLSSRLSYGCMRVAGTWNPAEITPERRAAGKRAILAAFEAGYTLFDHANIYCRGSCESIFGEVLREQPELKRRALVITKCGIRFAGDPHPTSPHRYDFSAEHILHSCELSLKRLNVQTIDVYQLHRPDLLMDPAEIAAAFDKLRQQGKVRYFGVSNFSPSFVSALQSALPFPLVVNQVEIHLGRLDCFTDGTLDQCLENRITPLSWSPLAGGLLGTGGQVPPQHPRHDVLVKLVEVLDKMAAALGVSRTVVALAWLLKHPSGIIPIVGSCNPEHIRDAVRADSLELSREQWYELLVAARGKSLP